MIAVIFGAGASYDSVPSQRPKMRPADIRPPLANDLFLDRPLVRDALRYFPQCHPIIPYLQAVPAGQALEHVMEELREEAKADIERAKQMAAVRYFLHFLIWEHERHWADLAQGITNHVTLLDQLRRVKVSNEPAMLITFNYDRLIEDALKSVRVNITSIHDYIQHNEFKLFKLHGSVNWGKEILGGMENITDLDSWKIVSRVIEAAPQLELGSLFHVVTEHPIARHGDKALFPAIAVPVETNKNFECPEEHLVHLKELLPRVKTMIILGWRGTEKHFLEILKSSCHTGVQVCTVAESLEAANAILEQLQDAGLKINGTPFGEGFTEFVIRREVERFLA